MTDQEINRTIALHCGWTRGQATELEFNKTHVRDFWVSPSGRRFIYGIDGPPDYCNDLNAIHEAEKSVPRHLWPDYAMEIRRIIQRDCNSKPHYILGCERAQMIADFWFYHATARQRSEALLRTIGKWPEKDL